MLVSKMARSRSRDGDEQAEGGFNVSDGGGVRVGLDGLCVWRRVVSA